MSSKSIDRISSQLFADEEEREAFILALAAPRNYPRALLWVSNEGQAKRPFSSLAPLSWQPSFVDRTDTTGSLGSHDLHEKGAYYLMDMSSIFSASVLGGVESSPHEILDLCSSPGGKGIYSWVQFRPSLLVCNEVIGKRHRALVSNLRRCCIHPSYVTQLDSSQFSEQTPNTFDLVIVDAPCSGQSLLVKGKKQPGGFHAATISMNAKRQKRILANAAACVSPGGYLAYMTCTFSKKENEGVLEWFLKRFSSFEAVEYLPLQDFRSTLTDVPCYRLFPHSLIGAGAFTCLLRNTEMGEKRSFDICDVPVCWSSQS
ncbi:MAG: RsmB/NOP family class I SAM-dependent RNA methyltransferase [Bdellovibrionales bacterium]|nr:RsmB/NOP family class I SAM-dependent RNA methyltransferase [Bdellovibrionales bacterium]